jgi:hypothetical protein
MELHRHRDRQRLTREHFRRADYPSRLRQLLDCAAGVLGSGTSVLLRTSSKDFEVSIGLCVTYVLTAHP